jgi:hypothetical protein
LAMAISFAAGGQKRCEPVAPGKVPGTMMRITSVEMPTRGRLIDEHNIMAILCNATRFGVRCQNCDSAGPLARRASRTLLGTVIECLTV